MLLLHGKFDGLPVASIQSGHRVAVLSQPIINPHNLSIEAFFVDTGRKEPDLVLHTSDIRDVTQQGIIIDHDEQIMNTDDLVRLEKVMSLKFELIDKPVITEKKHKLGKVGDYVIDSLTFKIVRIQVRQSLFKNFSTAGLLINRSQIVKVTDKQVVVRDAAVKDTAKDRKESLLSQAFPITNPAPQKPAETQSSSKSA